MPGVPTSRGCEACRKQRKKCDQTKPSCSRCTRLQVTCAGSGVRRFIFVNTVGVKEEADQQNFRLITARSRSQSIYRMPSSSNESISALMVMKLSIADPRYDIKWAYGPFLDGIPTRLGHSNALDTATRALMLTLSLSPDARKNPSAGVLCSYSVAIEATRRALSQPEKAQCMMTMCATYFLLLCQNYIGMPEDIGIHIAGIAHQLNNADSDFDPKDGFHRSVVLVLCSIINAEMILDSRLSATESSRCWTFFDKYIAQGIGPRGRGEPAFAVEQGLLRLPSSLSHFTHNVRPVSELWAYYSTVTSIIHDQASRFAGIHDVAAARFSNLGVSVCDKDISDEMRSYLRLMRSYGLSVTLGLVINTILRVYYPEKDFLLALASEKLISQLFLMATQAVPLQPLGAGFMVPFLNVAWSVIYRASPAKLGDAIKMRHIDPVIDRRIVFSDKLNKSFDALRNLINEQPSFSTDTSPRIDTPPKSHDTSRSEKIMAQRLREGPEPHKIALIDHTRI